MSRRRRGGGDRYKPSDLKRGLVRDGCNWPTPEPPNLLKLGRPVMVAQRAQLKCIHGVPWRDCASCSVVTR